MTPAAIAAAAFFTAQGIAWVPVTPQTVLVDVNQVTYSVPPGAVGRPHKAESGSSDCHVKANGEILFSLACDAMVKGR